MVWLNLRHRHDGRKFHQAPKAVGMMPAAAIVRGIRMRKFQWGKMTITMANEAGVSLETINAVLKGQPISADSSALLTTYLRTPAGKWALIQRYDNKKNKSRKELERKLRNLSVLAVDFELRVRSNMRNASTPTAELAAYYRTLEFWVKERIIKYNADLASRYILPDSLEAWQWIERFDLIRAQLTKSEKNQNARALLSGSRSRPTHLSVPSPSPSSMAASSGSAGATTRDFATTAQSTK